MKDIGLGILDPYTVVIVLVTLVLAQVLFGYQIPLDTANASQLFVSLVVFTGYIYAARSLVRLPVFGAKAAIYIKDHFDLWGNLKPEGNGFRFIKSLFKNVAGFLWLLPISLFYWFLLVIDFSESDYKDVHPHGDLKPLIENYRLRLVLSILDRISIVLIAFLSVLPMFQGYLQTVGMAGIIFMVLVFVLKGNLSALIRDELRKSPEKPVSAVSKDIEVRPAAAQTSSKIERLGIEIATSHCRTCGKLCSSRNWNGEVPQFCSTKCRQAWFPTWDKDWYIGDGEARKLIEEARASGYLNQELLAGITAKLESVCLQREELPENFIWVLFGMIRDISCEDAHEWQCVRLEMVRSTLNRIAQKKNLTDLFLLDLLLDENTAIVQTSLKLIEQNLVAYTPANKTNIQALLKHDDQVVRQNAMNILGAIGELKELFDHLGKNGNMDDRHAISVLGKSGKDAVLFLKQAQKHPFEWIRQGATQALINLGIETTEPEFVVQRMVCPNKKCRRFIEITYPRGFEVTQKDVYKLRFFQRSKIKNRCSYCGKRIGLKLNKSQEQEMSEFLTSAKENMQPDRGWEVDDLSDYA